jgi:hypothetical protein
LIRDRVAELTSRISMTVRVVVVASALLLTGPTAPLCRIARWNRPCAAGSVSKAPMLMAPADSPNTVTRCGSPPKAAILSWTQRKAAT